MADTPTPIMDPVTGTEQQSSPSSSPDLEPHQVYREITPITPQSTNVVQAVHAATADRRYTLLLELVTTIPAAKALVEERLLVPILDEKQKNLKRKAYEICGNCGEEYSIEGNEKGDCVYHAGEKEEDDSDDFWADHPEGMGEPEDYIDDPEKAGGFRWTCCDEKGDAEGCVVSRHVSKEDTVVKKARPVLEPVSANAASFRGPGGRQVVDLS